MVSGVRFPYGEGGQTSANRQQQTFWEKAAQLDDRSAAKGARCLDSWRLAELVMERRKRRGLTG
jgi:hypothetical protein